MSVDLTSLPGVVIHQHANVDEAVLQAVGVDCWERRNHFSIKLLPPDNVSIVETKSDPNMWQPSFEEIQNLPTIMTLSEKSDNLIRCCFAFMGCRGCRPLQLKVYHEGEEKGIVDKPCKCGGCFCCPLEMTLHDDAGNMVGHVRENFSPYCGKCFQCCCKGSYYHNVYTLSADNNAPSTNTMDREGGEPSYELDVNICCCGKNNNCFGATCCAHNSIFDISRVSGNNNKKELASTVQKMYAPASGAGCEACGRMLGAFDTFAIRFPEGSTQQERMMLIVAVLQAEFQLFEM
jgi:hypothetical protein